MSDQTTPCGRAIGFVDRDPISSGLPDESEHKDLLEKLYASALSGLCANPYLTGHEPEQIAARALAIAEAAADRFENDGERS